MRGFDRIEQVVGRIVDSIEEGRVTFGIRSPEDDDLIQPVRGFEGTNVGSNLVEVRLFVGSRESVVGSFFLVGVDESWVVDRGEWLVFGHFRGELALEIVIENASSTHSFVE